MLSYSAGQRLRVAVQRALQRPAAVPFRAMSAESAAVSDNPAVRQTGTVAFYSREEGYGFIRPNGVEPVAYWCPDGDYGTAFAGAAPSAVPEYHGLEDLEAAR